MANTIKNTIKTLTVFYGTMLRKYLKLGIKSKLSNLNDIYNYIYINEAIATSGQPTAKQFAMIRDADFSQVINLAPHHAENALKGEAEILKKLGISYTHIPVDFMHPSETDFEVFVEAMQSKRNEKIWVHCAANMRVSAFVYRYRRDVLKEDAAKAKLDMDKIWLPFGEWQKFLNKK